MQKVHVYLMTFMLVMQIISNGLFIPMTASATDNVVTNETTQQENADAEKEAIEKATAWVNDLFTDNQKTAIKSSVNAYTFNAYAAFTKDITDEDAQLALQRDVDLAKAFLAVNDLFESDEQTVEGLTQVQVDAAKAQVQLVDATTYEKTKDTLLSRIDVAQQVLEEAVTTEEQPQVEEKKEVAKEVVKEKVVVKKKDVEKTEVISGNQDLKNYITNIELTKGYQNGDPLDPTAGLTVNQEFGVKASIAFNEDVKEGTVFTYTIPAGTYVKEAGSVALQGGVQGKLSWTKDGEIKLTVGENLPAGTSGGFIFRSWVAESITETPWELNYEMAGEAVKTIDLTIKEAAKPKPVLKKEGTNNGISYDTKELTYTIEFSGVEGAEAVADKLPAGVTFKNITSVTRAEYNKFTGKYGEAKYDTSAWEKEPASDDFSFNFKRQGGIGVDQYKIVYTVNVKDPQDTDLVEVNKVALVNNTSNVAEVSSNTINIKHADAYQKTSPTYDAKTQTVTWRIVYNLNGKDLGAQTIKDYFSNGFTFSNFKVYEAVLGQNSNGSPNAQPNKSKELSGVTVSNQSESTSNCPNNQQSCQHVEINMPAVGTNTYVIEYTTKAQGIVNGGKIYNKAMIGTWNKTASRNLTNGLGVKTGLDSQIDYANKVARWEIKLRTSTTGTIKENAKIVDTFVSKGMTLDKNSFVVTTGFNNSASSLETLGATITDITEGNGGFILTFSKEIPENTIIKYNTKFDLIHNPSGEIRNIANLEYNNGLEFELGKYSQWANPESVDDGNKSGVYNPDTKRITWTVNINYYSKEIKNPVLTDTLESNQAYVANSLKVYNATVNSNGTITQGSEVTSEWTTDPSQYANQKTFTLKGPSSIDRPYQIVYETKIDAATDVHKATAYKNTAVLTSGDQTLATFTKTPSDLNNGDEFINKGYKKNGNKQYNWTVDINRSQSELKNVVVEDTQQGTLVLDEGSFKLERYDYVNGKLQTTAIPVVFENATPATIPADTAVAVKSGDRYFKLYLGDISRAYKLTYTSTYEGAPAGEVLSNEAKLFVSNSEKEAGGTNGATITANQVAYTTGLAWLDYKPSLAIHKIAAQTSNNVDVKVADLADVSFKLYDEMGTLLLDQGTTDANGDLQFKKPLAAGYYYLVEETALEGYKKFGDKYKGTGYINNYASTQDQTLPLTKTIGGKPAIRVEVSAKTVNSDKRVDLTVSNYLSKATGCTVTFINKEGDKTLKGSEYKVTDKDGNVIVENVKAGNDGKIVTPQLPKGDYVLVQTKSPQGSETTAPEKAFTVTDECAAEPIVIEQPAKVCTELTITIDSQTSLKPKVGTTVTVTPEGGKATIGKIVDKDGVLTVEFKEQPTVSAGQKLVISLPGYDKVETTAPADCEGAINIKPEPTKLACDKFGITVKSNDKAVKNATVTVQGTDIKGTTDEAGKVVFNDEDLAKLTVGTTLVISKNGYETKTITIDEAQAKDCGMNINLTKTACTQFTFTVTGPNGEPIENAEVKVYGDETLTTDDKGQVTFEHVVTPTSQIVVTADGYTTVQLTVGETDDCELAISMKEAPKVCPAFSVDIEKSPYLVGATVLVKDGTDTPVKGTVTTTGDIVFDGAKPELTPGKIVEISQDGYEKQTIVIQPDAPCKLEVELPAKPKACEHFTIEVTDQNGKPVKGATITASKVTATTDETGVATLDDATKEKFIEGVVVKVTADNHESQTFTITKEMTEDCGTAVKVTLTKLVKQCDQFSVTVKSGEQVVKNATVTVKGTNIKGTTDETGKVVWNDQDAKQLEVGSTLIISKNGYEEQALTITEDTLENCQLEVNVTKTACTQFTFTVTGPNGEPIENAEVKVYGEGTLTTDAQGTVTFEDVTVTPETKILVTADGYKTIQTTVGDTDECELTASMEEAPKVCPAFSVDIEKSPYLAGATVVVKDGSETPAKGIVTATGEITFEGTTPELTPGTIIEIAQDGYEKQTIVLQEEAPCKLEVELPAKPKACEHFTIEVTDQNGNPVKDATITASKVTATTNEAGIATLDDATKEKFTEGVLVKVAADNYSSQTFTITKAMTEDCETAVKVVLTSTACPQFTVTVQDENGVMAGATVTVEGSVMTGTTAANGQITFDQPIKEGTVITVAKDGYKTVTTVAGQTCEAIVTIAKNTSVTPPVITPPITPPIMPTPPTDDKETCEKPVVKVTTSTDPLPTGTIVTVTTPDGAVTGKVVEDGTVTFDEQPTFKPGTEITVTVDGYEPTTTTINEQDCVTTVTVVPTTCDQPSIVVTTTGEPLPASTPVKVTTPDGTFNGTVNEDGTITFDETPTFKPGTIVTVTVDGYEPTPTTISEQDCVTVVTVTPVVKACDEFTATIFNDLGETINVVKVTVNGKTVKTTDGTFTTDEKLTPGTEITFTKSKYETATITVGDECEEVVTLFANSDEPTPNDRDDDEDGNDDNDGNNDFDIEDPTAPDDDDSDNDHANGDNNNGNQNGGAGNADNAAGNKDGNNNAGNGNNTNANAGTNNHKTPANNSDAAVNANTNGNTKNATATPSSLLPQTGTQIMLYSLLGMMLIGAAFLLFKRARRQA